MPTVFHVGPYRFFFYANDRTEPIHVHVERDSSIAKFWVRPVRLAENNGFRPVELRRIRGIVLAHENSIVQRWHGCFGA